MVRVWRGCGGHASLCPPLYGGVVKRGAGGATGSLRHFNVLHGQFLCSTEGRFFVPTAILEGRRAQPQSRLAVAGSVPKPPPSRGPAWTGGSTARGSRVGTK